MHCKDTILRTQNNWPYSKLIPNSGSPSDVWQHYKVVFQQLADVWNSVKVNLTEPADLDDKRLVMEIVTALDKLSVIPVLDFYR